MKNKALAALEPFIGNWDYTMYNCWFLKSMDDTMKGSTSFERLEGGLLVMRETDADKKPGGMWVLGYSDPQERYEMLYYDERGVSRIFNSTFDGKTLHAWREDKDMHQKMTLTINDDGTLHGIAEASDDQGKTWRKDFDMSYTKADPN